MTAADSVRLRIMPPTVLLASMLAMYTLSQSVPLWRLWQSPDKYAGLLPMIAGFGLVFYCTLLFRRSGTTIRPFEESQTLITSGPYQYSRNPIYLGMVLILCGCAILLATASAWLIVPGFVAIIHKGYISSEEKMLQQKFAEGYREYCQQVRRWI